MSSSPRLPPPPPSSLSSPLSGQYFPLFHKPLTLHAFQTNPPLLQHYWAPLMEKIHHTDWTRGASVSQSDTVRQMCVSASLYTVQCIGAHTGGRERGRERGGRERGKPLCLSWHWANHLPLRAMAGTNLLKVICNHCGWKGLPHQWAFVRHFISKFRGRKKKKPYSRNICFNFYFLGRQPSHPLIWFWRINSQKSFLFTAWLLSEECHFLKWCMSFICYLFFWMCVCLNGVMCRLYPLTALL